MLRLDAASSLAAPVEILPQTAATEVLVCEPTDNLTTVPLLSHRASVSFGRAVHLPCCCCKQLPVFFLTDSEDEQLPRETCNERTWETLPLVCELRLCLCGGSGSELGLT